MNRFYWVCAFGCLLLAGCGAEQLSIDEKLERAKILCDRDRIDEALQLLNEISSRAPENVNALYLKGVSFEKQQSIESAKAAYDACLKLDPNNADALNNRGVINAKLGHSDEALADLLKATSLNPNDALAWSNLALVHHDLGQFDQAIAGYQRAIQNQDQSRFSFQIGNVYLDTSKWAEAEAAYTHAIERDSLNANAYLNRITAYIEQRKFDLARRDIEQVKSLDHDLVLRSAIQDRVKRLNREESPERQWQMVSAWLDTKGWKADSTSVQHVVTNKTDSTEATVLLMSTDEQGNVICNADESNKALESDGLTILVVIDPVLLGAPEPVAGADPLWLVHSNFAWKPSADEFSPKTVVYQPISNLKGSAPLPPK